MNASLKLENKSKPELIQEIKEHHKWEHRRSWLMIIGNSILILILTIALIKKLV